MVKTFADKVCEVEPLTWTVIQGIVTMLWLTSMDFAGDELYNEALCESIGYASIDLED